MADSFSSSSSVTNVVDSFSYTSYYSTSWNITREGGTNYEESDKNYSLISTNYSSSYRSFAYALEYNVNTGVYPNCFFFTRTTVTRTNSASAFGSTELTTYISSSSKRFDTNEIGSSTIFSSTKSCRTTQSHDLGGGLCEPNDPTACGQLDPCPTFSVGEANCVEATFSGSGTSDNRTIRDFGLFGTKTTGTAEVRYANPRFTTSNSVIKTNTWCDFSLTNTKTSGEPVVASFTETDTTATYADNENPDVFYIEVTTEAESYYTTETQTDWTTTAETSTTTKTETDTEYYTTTEVGTTSISYDENGNTQQIATTATSNSKYETTAYTSIQDTTETTTTGGSTTTITALTSNHETTTTATQTSFAVRSTDTVTNIYTTGTTQSTWESGPCSYIATNECKTYETSEVFPTPDAGSKDFPPTYTGLLTQDETDRTTETDTGGDSTSIRSSTYFYGKFDTVFSISKQSLSSIAFLPWDAYKTIHASDINYSSTYILRTENPCGEKQTTVCEEKTSQTITPQLPFPNLYPNGVAKSKTEEAFGKTITSSWLELTVSTIDYNTTETETSEFSHGEVGYDENIYYPNNKVVATKYTYLPLPATYWSTFRCLSSWVTDPTKASTDQLSWTWGTFRTSNIFNVYYTSSYTKYIDDPSLYCSSEDTADTDDPTQPPPPDEDENIPTKYCVDLQFWYDFQIWEGLTNRNNIYYEQSPYGYIGFGDHIPESTSTISKYFAGISMQSQGGTFNSNQVLNIDKTNISTYAAQIGKEHIKALIYPTKRCDGFGNQAGTTAWGTNDNIVNFGSSTLIDATYSSTTDTFVTLPPDITITSTTTSTTAQYSLSLSYSYDNISSFSANLNWIPINISRNPPEFKQYAILPLKPYDITMTHYRNQLTFRTFESAIEQESVSYGFTQQLHWETTVTKRAEADAKKQQILEYVPWMVVGTHTGYALEGIAPHRDKLENGLGNKAFYVARPYSPNTIHGATKLGYTGPLIEECEIIET